MRALSDLVRDFRSRSGIDLYELRRRAAEGWPKAAGERIAEYSSVIGFLRDELRVAVHHPAAGMEIRSRQAEILEALNAAAGKTVFERIVVIRRRGGTGQREQA